MAPGRPRRLVGRCPLFFLLAVSFDVLGFCLILSGVFAELQLNGRSFGEFLIYGGGILLFFSLLWWLAWYSLNLEVSMEELMKDPQDAPKKRHLAQLARKASKRFSKRSRRKAEGAPDGLPSAAAVPTTSTFINHSFSGHPDCTAPGGQELSNGGAQVDRLV
ncbi:transmembrane protein 238-like [Dendrobates tinctorius]|uniref:transmembrane protein 238-like n=1 Tax=Dendrobates tinctorius TaxID=92724 RepID=UPI003CCA6DC7